MIILKKTALWPLQEAIFQRLSNDAALRQKVTGVYDHVPNDTNYPYVTVGEPITSPFDTKVSAGENIPWTLHCYSNYQGKKEAYEILNLMIQAMAKKVWKVEGYKVMRFKIEPNIQVINPADVGFPYQGILKVRFYIEH